MRVQRTRFASLRSPLTRGPLGGTGNVVAALLVVSSSIRCHSYWNKEPQFVAALTCHMTPAEVTALAHRFGSTSFRRNTDQRSWIQPVEYYLTERSSGVRFWFFGDRLSVYQESRRFGLEGLDLSVPRDVCTKRPAGLLILEITAPLDLAGGMVLLDGMAVEELRDSQGPARNVEVRLLGLAAGPHEVAVENGVQTSVRQQFSYRPQSAWPTEQRIQLDLSHVGHSGGAA
jgi:hypothetical protein